jgi:cell division protein FtsI/penicillin-binding protein 2
MRAVVNAPEGTGIASHSDQIAIAGKTGTAQTHVPGRTHGWFIGFCPVERPVAAMAIVAEYGGSGGELPAAIAKAICEYVAAASGDLSAPMPEA